MTVALPPTPEVVPFALYGTVLPLAKGGEREGWIPSRPLGGWLATYGKLDDHGNLIETRDRDGHVFEAAGPRAVQTTPFPASIHPALIDQARALGRIDFTDYLRKGRWNDTHDEGRIVGIPTSIEFHDVDSPLAKAHRKVGWWTEGHLLDAGDPRSWTQYGYEPTSLDLERADHYWNLATMLKGLPRELGFSAHGKMILSPCKKRIIWAKVAQNAVCEMPKNPDATALPLRLATMSRIAVDMVGRNPCETCSCPPGARCAVVDARKGYSKDVAESAIAHVGRDEDDRLKTLGPGDDSFDNLVASVMAWTKCTQETATRWVGNYVRELAAGRAGGDAEPSNQRSM